MPGTIDVAAGYGDQPNGNFIPEKWSVRMQKKFYDYTVLEHVTNSDWEGEIKGSGSKVHIRVIPTINIGDYQVGTKIVYQDLDDAKIELDIDKAKYYAFGVDDVNKIQNDIVMLDRATLDAAQQMKITIETQVFSTVYGNVASGNDLGAATITKANILDKLVDISVRLNEQNVPQTGRFVLLPPWACGMISRSDLQDASLSGDAKSLLRMKTNYGYEGQSIAGLSIYNTNLLTTTGGAENIIAGTPDFICFASQFVKTETGRRQDTFGDFIRGLKVYGYKETKPEAGITGAWTKGT